jgi:hypothetical protein
MKKIQSSDWTTDHLKEHFDYVISLLHEELQGFPEQYALRKETFDMITILRDDLGKMREDHVRRSEIQEVKEDQSKSIEKIREQLDIQSGRRSGLALAGGIIATVLAVMFGFIWNSQVTRAEISDQIQREAPWNKDKTGVISKLAKLESDNVGQRIMINQMQTQIKFFCETRVKADLPGC